MTSSSVCSLGGTAEDVVSDLLFEVFTDLSSVPSVLVVCLYKLGNVSVN